MVELRQIELRGNPVATLPETMRELHRLEKVDLRWITTLERPCGSPNSKPGAARSISKPTYQTPATGRRLSLISNPGSDVPMIGIVPSLIGLEILRIFIRRGPPASLRLAPLI